MATITKTIGTSGRDYSTISAWEADLNEISIYESGDKAIGECYADSTFDETVLINGGGYTSLEAITLRAASTEKHNGVAGEGVKIKYSGSGASGPLNMLELASPDSSCDLCVEDLEIADVSMKAENGDNDAHVVKVALGNTPHTVVRRLLIHDITWPAAGSGTATGDGFVFKSYNSCTFMNCFIYDCRHTRTNNTLYGLYPSSGGTTNIYNCSFFNLYKASGSANLYGIFNNGSSVNVKNVIVFLDSTGHTDDCFVPTGSAWDYNMASDSSTVGDNSLNSQTASLIFSSTTSGAEDLHLLRTGNAAKAGVNLSGVSEGIAVDIDGRSRPAVWDMGGDQLSVNQGEIRKFYLAPRWRL